jgi:MoaA/NifB/PqqE/SkfB family radical SAM enzyme
MVSRARQAVDILGLMKTGGPSICNISITNVCNARCDFCGYAYDKQLVSDRAYVDFDRLCAALDILYDRGVRYLTFSGGEPLLHPRVTDMVSRAVAKGMRPSVVTNGWLLPRRIDALASAGLKTLFISIDAANAAAHEANRGLNGVCERIRAANADLKRAGIKSIASVTISKLIDDYGALARFLRDLGFETVTFSYPKRKALGTSSLVYSETSSLVDFTDDELIAAFQAIKTLKREIEVLNPAESLDEMIRHLRGERELFPCFGGYKYFYLDWKLDVYRCDSWTGRMCSIWSFKDTPAIRDGCTACMSDCYRDSSVLLHFAVSIGDAIAHLARAELGDAARALATDSNWRSVKALIGGSRTLSRLARTE